MEHLRKFIKQVVNGTSFKVSPNRVYSYSFATEKKREEKNYYVSDSDKIVPIQEYYTKSNNKPNQI